MTESKFLHETAVWLDREKNRLRVKREIINGDKTTVEEVVVSRLNVNGSPNKDFVSITEEISEVTITANTNKRTQNINQNVLNKRALQKEREKNAELERLFQAKINSFEIQEVKDSSNKKLKSRLRKSKSVLEVSAMTAVIIMDQINNGTEEKTD